jgi:acetyl-CoA acetyltransferase
MTSFGRHMDRTLKDLAGEAIDVALTDAGIQRGEVEMAFVANAMASIVTGQVSVVGQTILRALGFEDIPAYNIDNACAGSSSALNLAVQAIRSGSAEVVLVAGVEKLYAEDRARAYRALNGAADVDFVAGAGIDIDRESVFVKAIYPRRLSGYAARHGLDATALAEIAVKNRSNAARNPLAQFRTPLTVDDVLDSRMIVDPVTAFMCAPIGDGAAAAVVMSAARARAAGIRPVWIRGSAIGMGVAPGGASSIARTAARAYEQAGIGPRDIDLAEVHDSIAFNELLAYEELGLCDEGGGAGLVGHGVTRLEGRLPVNPSGGLESRGHPVAATGLAQIAELTWQLRGQAGERQVAGAGIGLAENAGGFAAGDTAAVAITILGAE